MSSYFYALSVDEQFLLKRLADAAIDIYSMAVTLSRASRSLDLKVSTSEYETVMTKTFCAEAFQRAKTNLTNLKNSQALTMDGNLKSIAKEICSSTSGAKQQHPLGF